MALTLEDMKHVAKLARLELEEERLVALMKPINALMAHFERLQQLSTEEVEPTSHAIPVHNVFRPDEIGSSLKREAVLEAAPEARDGFFIVPRIVEE